MIRPHLSSSVAATAMDGGEFIATKKERLKVFGHFEANAAISFYCEVVLGIFMEASVTQMESTDLPRPVNRGEGNSRVIVPEVDLMTLNRRVVYMTPILRLQFDTRIVCVLWEKSVKTMEPVYARILTTTRLLVAVALQADVGMTIQWLPWKILLLNKHSKYYRLK